MRLKNFKPALNCSLKCGPNGQWVFGERVSRRIERRACHSEVAQSQAARKMQTSKSTYCVKFVINRPTLGDLPNAFFRSAYNLKPQRRLREARGEHLEKQETPQRWKMWIAVKTVKKAKTVRGKTAPE